MFEVRCLDAYELLNRRQCHSGPTQFEQGDSAPFPAIEKHLPLTLALAGGWFIWPTTPHSDRDCSYLPAGRKNRVRRMLFGRLELGEGECFSTLPVSRKCRFQG